VDHGLGGGFGYGRTIELYGNWSSGKTMLLYYALANNQRFGGDSILIESEGAFDDDFFATLGGDPSKLLVFADDETSTVERVFKLIEQICLKVSKLGGSRPVCVGWDGIAATGTDHLEEKGMDVVDMSHPKMVSQGCKLVTNKIHKAGICVIATNQTRENYKTKDSEPTTPGGKAWKFHASQRLELKFDGGTKTSIITDSNDFELGRWVVGYVSKNKLATPFARFRLPIYTATGLPHPVYKGRKTQLGIDTDQTLFSYYQIGRFFVNDKCERVVVSAGDKGGWFLLHPSIDKSQTKFHAGDWPKKLEQFPKLKTLLYDDLEIDPDRVA